ncbi:MAG: hypothetical protein D4S01_01415 [Dehalococcoidia bacterium]|nr:MAG: hypothetical protein D4S01_01415 [Dehalococcoidia bacterium]
MKKTLIALLVMLALISGSRAGWQRSSGRTKWISNPTAAPCFTRDRAKDVYPKRKVLIYPDTITILDSGNQAGTGVVYNTGYFTIDGSGDIYPIDNLLDMYSEAGDPGLLYDVEFSLDSSGDVYPKD